MEPGGLFEAFFIIHKSYACMKVVQSMVTIRLFTIIHIIGIKQLHTPPYHCLLAVQVKNHCYCPLEKLPECDGSHTAAYWPFRLKTFSKMHK